MMGKQTTKQIGKKFNDFNSVERLSKVSSSVATYTKEETRANMKKFWEQLLGVGEYISHNPSQGDMFAGQEILFSQKKHNEQLQQEAKPAIRAAYNYSEEILRVGERGNTKENQAIEYKLNDIVDELKRLATASVILEKEVIEATGQTIVNPGKYHVNFFEWLLIEIRQARMEVEDASSWLATVSSKNGKKKNYWQMYKKHGTKFGLSGERSVSTQTA